MSVDDMKSSHSRGCADDCCKRIVQFSSNYRFPRKPSQAAKLSLFPPGKPLLCWVSLIQGVQKDKDCSASQITRYAVPLPLQVFLWRPIDLKTHNSQRFQR